MSLLHKNPNISRFKSTLLPLIALALLSVSVSSCTKAVFESVDNSRYSLVPSDPIFVSHNTTASTEGQRLEVRVKNQLYRQGFKVVESRNNAKYTLHVELKENLATITDTSGTGSGVAFSVPLGDSFSLAVPITSSREQSQTSQSVKSRTMYIKVRAIPSNDLVWSGSATYNVGQPAPYYNSIINNLLKSYGKSYYGRIKIEK